jgi:Flp pilus assembly protein TadD
VNRRPTPAESVDTRLPCAFSAYCLALVSHARKSPVSIILGVTFLCALLFLIYRPLLPGSFLMDDHRLIKDDNGLTNGQFTPFSIWFQTDFTLSSLALWWQWRVWGENPAGYHVVNILLHGFSAALLWRLLARLKIPGAWLAAAVFAVHPVCVNSVARIAEIKNTLSLPFFLLSLLLYLRYEAQSTLPASRDSASRQTWFSGCHLASLWYGFSLVAFVLALLAKTSTVMLPGLLLCFAAWRHQRVTRQDLLSAGPFFLLALGFGLLSVWFQKHQALAHAGRSIPPETAWERLAAAGQVVWFYLAKALWPVNLNLVYPRWNLDPTRWSAFLPVFCWFCLFAFCWRFRRQWGQPVLLGLGCFIVALFPTLGFFDSQFLTMWQVSDHLQYLPLIAPVALAVAGLAVLAGPRMFIGIGAALLLVLCLLAGQRATVFASDESLLRDTLAKNPAAADAHNDLGVILAKRRDYTAATAHFMTAVQLDPDHSGAHSNLGQALALTGHFVAAEPHFLASIRLAPGDPLMHQRFAQALAREGKTSQAARQLQIALCLAGQPDAPTRLNLAELLVQTGDFRRAIDQYRKVLSLNTDQPEPLNNLAWLLATAPDAAVRNGAESVRYAEHACQLTSFKQSIMISTLAAAYAEAGRFAEAVTTAEMAIRMQTANGESQFAALNRQLLQLYRAGMAYPAGPAN